MAGDMMLAFVGKYEFFVERCHLVLRLKFYTLTQYEPGKPRNLR